MPTPKLALSLVVAEQASQEVPINKAIVMLDALGHVAVPSVASPSSTPPGSPADGDCHLVGTSATGAWSGHDDALAVYVVGSGWYFVVPFTGLQVFAVDTTKLHVYRPSTWGTGVSV